MSRQLIGIRQNAIQVHISGARVAFDPRTTEEVEKTRDPKNYKADEAMWRKEQWQERQRDKRREAAE
jgi:hypothetical protein